MHPDDLEPAERGAPVDPVLLRIDHKTAAERHDIVVAGELDLAGIDQMRGAVTEALRDAPAVVGLDLASLRFIDSIGLREVLRLKRLTEAQGGRLQVVACSPVVRRMFVLAGLETVLHLAGAETERSSSG